jgi:hypothetical protein
VCGSPTLPTALENEPGDDDGRDTTGRAADGTIDDPSKVLLEAVLRMVVVMLICCYVVDFSIVRVRFITIGHVGFLTKENGKEFVTLWGILLREARVSSKAEGMLSVLGISGGGNSRNQCFAMAGANFRLARSCNTIPHSVALRGERR